MKYVPERDQGLYGATHNKWNRAGWLVWGSCGHDGTFTRPAADHEIRGVHAPMGSFWRSANRLTSVTDWNSRAVAYTYDDAGRMTTATLPASTDIVSTYSYDNADRLTGIIHLQLTDYETASRDRWVGS